MVRGTSWQVGEAVLGSPARFSCLRVTQKDERRSLLSRMFLRWWCSRLVLTSTFAGPVQPNHRELTMKTLRRIALLLAAASGAVAATTAPAAAGVILANHCEPGLEN